MRHVTFGRKSFLPVLTGRSYGWNLEVLFPPAVRCVAFGRKIFLPVSAGRSYGWNLEVLFPPAVRCVAFGRKIFLPVLAGRSYGWNYRILPTPRRFFLSTVAICPPRNENLHMVVDFALFFHVVLNFPVSGGYIPTAKQASDICRGITAFFPTPCRKFP